MHKTENSLLDKLGDLELEAKRVHAPICGREKGQILLDIIAKHSPKTVLELGTCLGYSGTILASRGAKLTTVDRAKDSLDRAEEIFEWFGVDARLFFGDALDVLEKLQSEKFDLVFMDHMKTQYADCFEILKNMTDLVLIDNTESLKCAEFISHIKKTYKYEAFDDMLLVYLAE